MQHLIHSLKHISHFVIRRIKLWFQIIPFHNIKCNKSDFLIQDLPHACVDNIKYSLSCCCVSFPLHSWCFMLPHLTNSSVSKLAFFVIIIGLKKWWTQLDATCQDPETNRWGYWPIKSCLSIPTNTRGSQAGGVRLDGNLTSDFLVADMSNSAYTWDLNKGGDGKERHQIVKIMTVSQAHTSPRTQ